MLHTYAAALPDALNCSARDVILPVVPMFHVNAWGLPYVACMVGAKLVFPGPWLDGKSLHELFEAEGVTVSAGVPTVWQGLLTHVEGNGLQVQHHAPHHHRRLGLPAGDDARLPGPLRRAGAARLGHDRDEPAGHRVHAQAEARSPGCRDARRAIQAKQGRAVFGVDMKIVGEDGRELPRDGKASGELLVRGPWVISRYFKGEGGDPLVDGWFPTGDVATIDADGYHADHRPQQGRDQVRRRMDRLDRPREHRDGAPGRGDGRLHRRRHPKWDERPLLVVVKKPGADVTREELIASTTARSPSGGRPTTWSSSTRFRSAPPARCRRTSCASCSRTTACRPPERSATHDDDFHLRPGRRAAAALFPGVLACAVVAAAATFLSQHYGAPVMLFALLLGMAMNFLSAEGACAPGIEFTARPVLRIGVALLGLRITVAQVAALGWQPVLLVVVSVVLTIACR